jgi:DNA (cytosine-5)-methyltransferase 1
MNNAKFTYVAEFAGAGGTCLGAKAAGGECRLQIEWDPYDSKQNAFKNLVRNFPEVAKKNRIINYDITSFNGRHQLRLAGLKPGELDILTSSAPCQGWSSSNTKKQKDDHRNDLFLNSIKNIRITQPKIVLFENVKGLTTNKALRFKYYQIVSELQNAGYKVKTWVLDSKDYGIPQSRVRSWVIGIRKDLGIEPSVPDFSDKQIGLGDVLPHLQGHIRGQFDKDIIPANVPVSCITKTAGFKVIEDGIPRYPTIEELRVLSSFPEDYDFGDSSFNQVHNRVGNSVLPKMAEILMDHLYETVLKQNEPLLQKAAEAVNEEISLDSDLDDFSRKLLSEVA